MLQMLWAPLAVVGRELTVSERPDLGSADIVVSGGRGVGSAENLKSSKLLLTNWEQLLVHHVQQSTLGTCRMTIK